MHPFFKRACLAQPIKGHGDDIYHVFSIFDDTRKIEDGDPDYLPADLDKPEYQHLRGVMGDFQLPTP